MINKIDFATLDIRSGTGNLTLPAGRWLIVAVANVVTSVTGSFSTDVSWFGATKLFQGYRTPDKNRTQGYITWATVINSSASTTYAITTSGNACEIFDRQWWAVKLSN